MKKKRKSWVCTDPDCAQFRREAPEKGEKKGGVCHGN